MDKWLWAARLCKTRSQATEACRAGRVKVGGQSVKPSRAVRVGDTVVVNVEDRPRTVRVLAILGQRLSAAAVAPYLEDLTPKLPEPGSSTSQRPLFERRKGAGRPTKRERRAWDRLASGDW
jgi:ribosome-associated heat shock protein Hsp15